MLLWSRGLGQTEVYMDFRQYQTLQAPESKDVLILGKMQSPVTWEFVITLQPEDIAGVMKSLFSLPMLRFVLRNLHQYVLYLMKRKTFANPESNTEEQVRKAYSRMVKKERRIAA